MIQAIVDIRKRLDEDIRRAEELGLSDEDLAFFDAVTENAGDVYERDFLRDLVHDVVVTLKANLKVDWTEPHREQVRPRVRAAVKRVLRRRGVQVDHFEELVTSIMEQAEALYRDWLRAA